jgi:KRAB domain-containing zinc finger protein
MATYHIQPLHHPQAQLPPLPPPPPHMTHPIGSLPGESPPMHLGNMGKEEFECEFCDYKTFCKSNMTQHVRTVHDKIKDFACNRCDFRSARRANVNYHIKTVHENIKDYSCHFCNFKSARKYNVIQHSDRVHKHESQGEEVAVRTSPFLLRARVNKSFLPACCMPCPAAAAAAAATHSMPTFSLLFHA